MHWFHVFLVIGTDTNTMWISHILDISTFQLNLSACSSAIHPAYPATAFQVLDSHGQLPSFHYTTLNSPSQEDQTPLAPPTPQVHFE